MQLNIDNLRLLYLQFNSMNIRNYFNKITVLALFLFSLNALSFAQTTNPPAPREAKLLNEMKLLVWANPSAEKVSVKLRVHSGAAFDPLAKEGVMALLSEILFPNETSREYFEQDLGGSLLVESNYDYIQISATGDSDKILDILEAISAAVTKPQIDKDTTAKIKTAQLARVAELEKNPVYIADSAAAKRLFGNFPYGRAQLGTTETLSKLDFADILLAKQKFLTADNATLAVSGNVRFDFVHRAARRLFGGWEKSDKKIPATFTQPDAPDVKPLTINVSSIENDENRFAMSGFARNDKDYAASRILTKIYAGKSKNSPNEFIKSNSYMLRGIILIAAPATVSDTNNKQIFQITQDEFDKAKTEVLAELSQKNPADFWLDVDTYKLGSVKDELQKAQNVKFEDVQKVSEKLLSMPKITVILTKQTEATSKSN